MNKPLWAVALAICLAAPLAYAQDAGTDGSFWTAATVAETDGAYWGAVNLLQNGKVLFTGNSAAAYPQFGNVIPMLYDPATDSWSPTGLMGTEQYGLQLQTATVLQSGQVLVAGGQTQVLLPGGQPNHAVANSELYDPETNTWSPTGSLAEPRFLHSAVLLQNGQVLVAGGTGDPPDGGDYLISAELYDPTSGSWTPTGSLLASGSGSLVVLPSGQVLSTIGTTAELYDPDAGTWGPTGQTSQPLGGPGILLHTGKVLFTSDGSDAQLYDPATGTWSVTGRTTRTRDGNSVTLLESGKVLVAGGLDTTGNTTFLTSSAELYDPENGTWSPTTPLPSAQFMSSATLLQSGQVFAMGDTDSEIDGLSAELYTPAQSFVMTTNGSPPPPPPPPLQLPAGGCSSTGGSNTIALLVALLSLLRLHKQQPSMGRGDGHEGAILRDSSRSRSTFRACAGRRHGRFVLEDDGHARRELVAPSAVLLQSGKVLVTGGNQPSSVGGPASGAHLSTLRRDFGVRPASLPDAREDLRPPVR